MSEPFVNPLFGQRVHPAPDVEVDVHPEVDGSAQAQTGHTEVDAVLGSLTALDDLPVSEHVAVFEQAHESLRRTLSGAAQGPPAPTRV